MVDESATAKRRGRPRLPANEKKRHTMAFRLTSDVRDELERRSQESGRSISEEVERIISIDVSLQRERYKISDNGSNDPLISRKNNIASQLNDYYALQSIIERMTMDLGQLSSVCKTPFVSKQIAILMHYYFVFGRNISDEMELKEAYRNVCIDEYIRLQESSGHRPVQTKNEILVEMQASEHKAKLDRESFDVNNGDGAKSKIWKHVSRKIASKTRI